MSMGQKRERQRVTAQRNSRQERGAPAGSYPHRAGAFRAALAQGFLPTSLSDHDIDATCIHNVTGDSFTLVLALPDQYGDAYTHHSQELIWL